MINLCEETIIDAPVDKVYKFIANFDTLYHEWHPKSHIFCKAITGRVDKTGSIIHFLEFLRYFPLYMIIRITKVIPNQLIEAEAVPPLSSLKLGEGGFKFEKISSSKTKLIAYINTNRKGWLSELLTKIVFLFVPKKVALKHMREEGDNTKKYLRENPDFNKIKL